MKKFFLLALLFFWIAFVNTIANKTSIEIKAPSEVKKGSEITIIINVKHNGNSKMHYTDWVYLKIDGKEVKRWTYDKKNLPPDGNFTLEYKFTPTANVAIEAEGNCNMHGGAGARKATIATTN